MHHAIQNELLSIMKEMVLKIIGTEVKEAENFAVLADETRDAGKKEQLSVVVRYFHNDMIKERFLGFQSCASLNSESLLQYVKKLLSECRINIENCVAQTYDGA